MTSINRFAGVFCLALATSACVTAPPPVAVAPGEMESYLADKPERLKPLYRNVLAEGPRNAVLNDMRVGTAALDIGETQAAGEAFDKAIGPIEAIYANNEEAKKSRRLFQPERRKEFRGESYERAMVYYYRGLLDLMASDYENARASFKSGLIQDSMAEVEEYSQDFGSLAYLSGWASKCNGNSDLAKDSFAEAAHYNPALIAPGSADNLIVVGETGFAPQKVGQGKYKELLTIGPKVPSEDVQVSAQVGAKLLALHHAEDLYFQATTRGGRKFDAILAGKAQTKETLQTLGYVGMGAGALVLAGGLGSNNSTAMGVGAGLLVAGLIVDRISAATQPQADTRYWDNLPGDIHLATVAAAHVPASVTLHFLTEGGRELTSYEQTVSVHKGEKCSIAWGRAHRATDIPLTAPNSAL